MSEPKEPDLPVPTGSTTTTTYLPLRPLRLRTDKTTDPREFILPIRITVEDGKPMLVSFWEWRAGVWNWVVLHDPIELKEEDFSDV